MENIKVELQLKFWGKLEERLNSSLEKKGIIIEKNLLFPNHHYSKENIEKFYTNAKRNKWYGLMYFIKETKDRRRLYLRIEVESNLYYGLRLIDNTDNFECNQKDNFLEKELLNLKFERTNKWLGWKYIYNPKNLNQTLNFKEMNKELALLLNNDNELENLISEIEKEIIEKLEILFEE